MNEQTLDGLAAGPIMCSRVWALFGDLLENDLHDTGKGVIMHLRRFSNWFKKEQIPDKPNIIQWAYMGLFTCLTKDLEKASLPVIIRLTLEKQHLDYRIVADVTFEYSHCGSCGS